MATIHVDVVSAEEQIFSGEASFVALPGESGELGIMPRHTPLITRIKPGAGPLPSPAAPPRGAATAGSVGASFHLTFLAFSKASSMVPTM